MSSSKKTKFNSSRGSRFFSLGKLTTAVGSSYLGQAIKGAFTDEDSRLRGLGAAHLKNAARIARTFGELKGAVMKVGQMMSLQEDLLPAEMRDILRGLQNQAPPVPFEEMTPMLENELGARIEKYIDNISPVAHASASIGQVHRAELKDGRSVVIKIQYPDVDRMVESDLKNIRLLIGSIAGVTPMKADIDKLFNEVRARLMEELDYRLEYANMIEFRRLFKKDSRFIVPRPIKELSTRRVLVSEYVEGESAESLCGEGVSQERRDLVGFYLADCVLIQLFDFQTLQADPNLANFAFTADDRVIMYDFGCVKRFPISFTDGLRKLMGDALLGRYHRLEADLEEIGFLDLGKKGLPLAAYREYADIGFAGWREPGLFDFGASNMHDEVYRLNRQYWQKSFDFDPPADMIFLNRTLGGMYGNLRKLKARIDVHRLLSDRL